MKNDLCEKCNVGIEECPGGCACKTALHEWININDQVPKKNGNEYLGYGNGRFFIFSYRMSDWHECSKGEIAYEVNPAYWMELPEPPK